MRKAPRYDTVAIIKRPYREQRNKSRNAWTMASPITKRETLRPVNQLNLFDKQAALRANQPAGLPRTSTHKEKR